MVETLGSLLCWNPPRVPPGGPRGHRRTPAGLQQGFQLALSVSRAASPYWRAITTFRYSCRVPAAKTRGGLRGAGPQPRAWGLCPEGLSHGASLLSFSVPGTATAT